MLDIALVNPIKGAWKDPLTRQADQNPIKMHKTMIKKHWTPVWENKVP